MNPGLSLLSAARRRQLISTLLAILLLASLAQAPASARAADEPVDLEMVARIRQEAFEKSDVMTPAYVLTRQIGARMTGSSNLQKALDWCAARLLHDGLANVRLEQWQPFERAWTNEGVTVRLLSELPLELRAAAAAWTPGTEGMVRGRLAHVTATERKHLSAYKGKLRGRVVLLGGVAEEPEPFEHLPSASRRLDDEALRKLADKQPKPKFDMRAYNRAREFSQSLRQMLAREGALAALVASPRANSVVAYAQGSMESKEEWKLPLLVLSQQDFARAQEAVAEGKEAEVELEVGSRFQAAAPQFNLLAEIPGSDKKDELVMAGAHLDSVHVGEGATDNAAGVAVVMEAARILQSLGVKPRRTIRIVLWTGEEQGLYGSFAYVRNNLAALAGPGRVFVSRDYQRVSAYFNLDNGAGRIRGIYAEGNDRVRPIFERWMEPLRDLGAEVASPWSVGGTDHYPFDQVGIPAFQFVQDPLDYFTLTHHASDDTFDKLDAQDLQQAAAVLATFLYHAAMRDAPLPRKGGFTVRMDPQYFR